MKKFGLLITSPVGPDKNIGDYIQSLAAKQFIPEDMEIEYIEKEDISNYSTNEKVKCIMNAWYIWHPENWPPQENAIDPLLTSIHISPLTADAMLQNGGKEYFIKHGPVGCRDTGTAEILEKYQVPNFFSGCLTLSLGNSYKHNANSSDVIFVDPYYTPMRYVTKSKTIYFPKTILKSLWYFLKAPRKISILSKKEFFKGRIKLQTYFNASVFYHSYSKLFDDAVLLNAEYISHMVPVDKTTTQEELLKIADNLLKKYSNAKYIVTSRIHCALPCLGIGTPVMFVLDNVMESDKDIFNAPGRFGGLLDFFRIVSYSNNSVKAVDEMLISNSKIGKDFVFENKTNWTIYRDKLINQINKFVRK